MENNLKEKLIEVLEEHKNLCCDGTTNMVMEYAVEQLRDRTNLNIVWSGRTIYLKKDNTYAKLATIKTYKEKLAYGEGWVSSIYSYKLFI